MRLLSLLQRLVLRSYLRREIFLGYLLALTVILALGAYFYYSGKEIKTRANTLEKVNRITFVAERIKAICTDIETSQNGYVLTEDENYLDPYYPGKDSIAPYVSEFKSLAETLGLAPVAEQLDALVSRKVAFSDQVLSAYRSDGPAAARELILTLQGKYIMDDIRHIAENTMAQSRSAERRLDSQIADLNKQFNTTFIALLLSILVILMILFYAININFKARNEMEDKLSRSTTVFKNLYDKAPCGFFSIEQDGTISSINQTLLEWTGYTKEAVVERIKVNDLLMADDSAYGNNTLAGIEPNAHVANMELTVKKSNGEVFPALVNITPIHDPGSGHHETLCSVYDVTDLMAARSKAIELNKEMEAFSYSVSHDLRAPLRFMGGYARILSEEYGHKLDDEGRRLIEVITRNARTMGDLIDDLLNFTRSGRATMEKTTVDMDSMVDSVVKELMMEQNGRTIDMTIHKLGTSIGDAAMLRQVWINLISNALKYTNKSEHTRIEIGSFRENSQVGYYVKDNGVGFDAKYQHKLFQVFQRLHSSEEFEGTGVGLALIKTIVVRHGGKVWGTGEKDAGAKFCFTLPIN